MMKIVAAALAVVAGVAIVTSAAHADGPGPVTALYASPGAGPDTRQCLFFQTGNGSTWYAVPLNDPGYAGEMMALQTSYLSGQTVNFFVGSAVPGCSFPQAFDIYLGTIH